MHHHHGIFWFCGLAMLAASCATSPPTRFYTLAATPAPVVTPTRISVVVGPVSVPAVVDRPQIVVNVNAHQVTLDEFNQWASPLQSNIARVVADNLTAMLGSSRVLLISEASADGEYRATISVQRFESMPGEAAVLDAVWTVRRTKDAKTESGRTSARETFQEKSYDALAGAHSRALGRLSEDIAKAVRMLDRSGY